MKMLLSQEKKSLNGTKIQQDPVISVSGGSKVTVAQPDESSSYIVAAQATDDPPVPRRDSGRAGPRYSQQQRPTAKRSRFYQSLAGLKAGLSVSAENLSDTVKLEQTAAERTRLADRLVQMDAPAVSSQQHSKQFVEFTAQTRKSKKSAQPNQPLSSDSVSSSPNSSKSKRTYGPSQPVWPPRISRGPHSINPARRACPASQMVPPKQLHYNPLFRGRVASALNTDHNTPNKKFPSSEMNVAVSGSKRDQLDSTAPPERPPPPDISKMQRRKSTSDLLNTIIDTTSDELRRVGNGNFEELDTMLTSEEILDDMPLCSDGEKDDPTAEMSAAVVVPSFSKQSSVEQPTNSSASARRDHTDDLEVDEEEKASTENMMSVSLNQSRRSQQPSRPPPPQFTSVQQQIAATIEGKGLPSTPPVTMGACFSLIFEGCHLKIYSTATWIEPSSKAQIVIFGTGEGIYCLNLLNLHDAQLELLVPRRCIWLFVVQNTMIALGGKHPQLYTHDLLTLFRYRDQRTSTSMKKISKFVPKRFSGSTPIQNTKGCRKVHITRNPASGVKYLCAALEYHILVMEWYHPTSNFIEIKRVEVPNMPNPLLTFDALITRNQTMPLVCLGVYRTSDPRRFNLKLIDLNGDCTKWYDEPGAPEDLLPVVKVTQLEYNVILICFEDCAKVVSLNGKLKSSRSMVPTLNFGVSIESVVCLRDSVLAFHSHGIVGKSFEGKLTQEIHDEKHLYNLLGHDRHIVVESRSTDDPMSNSNIYLLAGAA